MRMVHHTLAGLLIVSLALPAGAGTPRAVAKMPWLYKILISGVQKVQAATPTAMQPVMVQSKPTTLPVRSVWKHMQRTLQIEEKPTVAQAKFQQALQQSAMRRLQNDLEEQAELERQYAVPSPEEIAEEHAVLTTATSTPQEHILTAGTRTDQKDKTLPVVAVVPDALGLGQLYDAVAAPSAPSSGPTLTAQGAVQGAVPSDGPTVVATPSGGRNVADKAPSQFEGAGTNADTVVTDLVDAASDRQELVGNRSGTAAESQLENVKESAEQPEVTLRPIFAARISQEALLGRDQGSTGSSGSSGGLTSGSLIGVRPTSSRETVDSRTDDTTNNAITGQRGETSAERIESATDRSTDTRIDTGLDQRVIDTSPTNGRDIVAQGSVESAQVESATPTRSVEPDTRGEIENKATVIEPKPCVSSVFDCETIQTWVFGVALKPVVALATDTPRLALYQFTQDRQQFLMLFDPFAERVAACLVSATDDKASLNYSTTHEGRILVAARDEESTDMATDAIRGVAGETKTTPSRTTETTAPVPARTAKSVPARTTSSAPARLAESAPVQIEERTHAIETVDAEQVRDDEDAVAEERTQREEETPKTLSEQLEEILASNGVPLTHGVTGVRTATPCPPAVAALADSGMPEDEAATVADDSESASAEILYEQPIGPGDSIGIDSLGNLLRMGRGGISAVVDQLPLTPKMVIPFPGYGSSVIVSTLLAVNDNEVLGVDLDSMSVLNAEHYLTRYERATLMGIQLNAFDGATGLLLLHSTEDGASIITLLKS